MVYSAGMGEVYTQQGGGGVYSVGRGRGVYIFSAGKGLFSVERGAVVHRKGVFTLVGGGREKDGEHCVIKFIQKISRLYTKPHLFLVK